jgi:death on curing protein
VSDTVIRYVTVDELIYINARLILPIHTIVEGKRAVRDMGLLEAAAGRPMQSVFGQDAYPTLTEKAAVLLHAIARNHPFADANKRTATVGAIFMLEVNGLTPVWQPADALERIVDLAEGKTEPDALAGWLPLQPGTLRPAPEAEADMTHMTHILRDHRWLLDALAAR